MTPVVGLIVFLVLFAVLMMAASYLVGQLTAGQDVKIIKDLGLAATSVFGLFIAVFIGIGLVSKLPGPRPVGGIGCRTCCNRAMCASS